ncbi:MAG: capsular biosynthesis protein [Gemmobacter sp.]|uniref:capsular polysaccharide export protein, LipB/KpsS family n=1 Tax=Gemmobacter sp. TaxID=1898957 RepID=UPI001A36D4E3|nr:capsular biosynthesis protein [Gemmobacter sp.]MBL8561893.1 capsular biosynthesis protein [Gemmobacter sp.]
MIVYPAEYNPRKEAVFAALAAIEGGQRLRFIPLRFRDYPETPARVAAALARAKRQPKGSVARWLKRQLIRGQYNWAREYFSRHPQAVAVAWNGLTGSRMAYLAAARDAGAATLYAELAPFPGRITLDPQGVNAEGSVPQAPEFYREWAAHHDVAGWREVGAGLTARESRRADVRQAGAEGLPDAPFLFCPLQVPDDSQVTLFAGWCGGMAGFLQALGRAAERLPGGWHLRLKEHPSAKMPLGPLLGPLVAGGRVVIDNATDSFAQVAASRGVVTLNSSMGLQAFFHDKPVITLGRAFFNLPGLVAHADSLPALEALFAAPDALGYDADLRAAFIAWLGAVYYPRFTWPGGEADPAAFAARLNDARRRSLA